MTTAQSIGRLMAGRTRTKDAVYTVVLDDHNVHCLTEPMLDTWWAALKPEDKAALYDLFMDGALEEDEGGDAPERIFEATGPLPAYVTSCGLKLDALKPELLDAMAQVVQAAQQLILSGEAVPNGAA